MGREPSSLSGDGLAVTLEQSGGSVAVTLTGCLELDCVEQLAACADQICRSTTRSVVFDVGAVTAVDDAGVRTLAAACQCLSGNGIEARVRGISGEFRRVLQQLGLTVPEPRQPAGTVPRPRDPDAVVER